MEKITKFNFSKGTYDNEQGVLDITIKMVKISDVEKLYEIIESYLNDGEIRKVPNGKK